MAHLGTTILQKGTSPKPYRNQVLKNWNHPCGLWKCYCRARDELVKTWGKRKGGSCLFPNPVPSGLLHFRLITFILENYAMAMGTLSSAQLSGDPSPHVGLCWPELSQQFLDMIQKSGPGSNSVQSVGENELSNMGKNCSRPGNSSRHVWFIALLVAFKTTSIWSNFFGNYLAAPRVIWGSWQRRKEGAKK